MGYFHRENIFLDTLIFSAILIGILLSILLFFSLPTIKSNDLTCSRSPKGVECSWLRDTQFAKNIEFKIIDPTSVRVIQDTKVGRNTSLPYFTAEITYAHPPIHLPLYSDYNDKIVRSLAQEINEFLLSPNTHSFHKKF
jgi:hypothetical protein